jgi:hypothetical protein
MDINIQETSTREERFPKSDHIELGSDGWLTPKGDYYKVGTTEHDESADYFVKHSKEVKKMEESKPRPWNYSDLNSREKLKELGYVLIRGEILRSDDVANYTPVQLEKINQAEIKVVSVFDGSMEYPTEEILEKITSIAQGLPKIEVVLQLQSNLSDLELGKSERTYEDQFREQTMRNINDFMQFPLKTAITDCQFYNPETHEVLSTGIFDYLSRGYSDEMKINSDRSFYSFRVVDLENCKLLIQRIEYFHDGVGGGMSGDINNYISMSVVDNRSLKEELSKLISHSNKYHESSKIEFKKKDGYFAEIMSDVITSP